MLNLFSVSLKSGNRSLSCERCLPYSWGKKDSLIFRDRELGQKNLYESNSSNFFTNVLPKLKLCLNSLLIKSQSLLLCPINSFQIYCSIYSFSLSKKYKSCLFWSFLRQFCETSMWLNYNLFLFLLLIWAVWILLLAHSQELKMGRGGNGPLPNIGKRALGN